MQKMIEGRHYLEARLSSPAAPVYGWDESPVVLSADRRPDDAPTATAILFIGDSVTRGFGLATGDDAYPALVFRALTNEYNVRVINAAVQAFGVDQMILKLEQVISTYRPDIVVFAYIPDDLWRPGRDINYGLTKPVLVDIEAGNWRIVPAPSMSHYYQDYGDANRRFYLGVWSLRHLFGNARYYFSSSYSVYYHNLFLAIRIRLVALADRYRTHVLVVRLASTWPGRAIPALDGLARHAFAASAGMSHYTFLDLENCVRANAKTVGLDYAEEFKYHPGLNGHVLYANCLVDPLRNAMAAATK